MIVIKSGIVPALSIEIVAEMSANEVATGTTAAAAVAAVEDARVLDPVLIRASGATARVHTHESPRKTATHAKSLALLLPSLVFTASANDPRASSLNLQLILTKPPVASICPDSSCLLMSLLHPSPPHSMRMRLRFFLECSGHRLAMRTKATFTGDRVAVHRDVAAVLTGALASISEVLEAEAEAEAEAEVEAEAEAEAEAAVLLNMVCINRRLVNASASVRLRTALDFLPDLEVLATAETVAEAVAEAVAEVEAALVAEVHEDQDIFVRKRATTRDSAPQISTRTLNLFSRVQIRVC